MTSPMQQEAAWGVVVPVKQLAAAKSRLAAYGDTGRRRLALAFAEDVVMAVLACPAVTRVLVVTDDDEAAAALRALGADITPDDPDDGLNAALSHGADLLRRARPELGVVTVSSDLPALRPMDLAGVLACVPAGTRAFVSDAAGGGTTLLAAAAPAALSPAYGPSSALRHHSSGAHRLQGTAGLRHDVDTPDDLRAALALGVGSRTAAVVATLPVLR